MAAAFSEGDIVDRYRLEARLGAGTFGEVWRASQLTQGQDTGRRCAIKMMRLARDGRTDSSADAAASGWLDEVRALQLAANRRAGETIPEILDANVWADHAYIAMELLEGATLATRIVEGPVPWRRALAIALQIAQALEAAHAEGIVHRDLKPQNVILVGDLRACVIDWGIARMGDTTVQERGVAPVGTAAEVGGTEAEPPLISSAPRRVALVGTPGYIAPEVYEGAVPAASQDVFALGIVLYEMLAGKLPHDVPAVARGSQSSEDSVRAYRTGLDRATQDGAFVPLRKRGTDLPDAVIELVDSLLASDPAKRPTNVRDAIEHVNQYPYGIPSPPYAGLGNLGLEHAGLFFGQDEAIASALLRLRDQRAILLWGPSGSGKSSLAVAGVAATADRRLFLGLDGWRIDIVRPRDPRGLRLANGEAEPNDGQRNRLGQLVVFDQLEEVVDLAGTERDDFVAAVLALVEGSQAVTLDGRRIEPTVPTRVIATIRDDLEWRVDREVPALRPLLERRVIVKGVDANFARSIIAEPARSVGYDVEDLAGVAREVEDRLSADPAKLPVVQYALSEWWERRDESKRVLPAAAWKELGGVDGALSFVAERFYLALDAADQDRVRTIFTQLFRGGRKRPVPESQLGTRPRQLAEELARLRLVGRRVKKDAAPFFEAEHESLSSNWSRLAGWLAAAREDQLMLDEIEADAAAYARDRDVERLWKKGRLAAALEVSRRGQVSMTASARSFLGDARKRARRGRIVLATVASLAVTLMLGLVYALVLSAASSKERDQAVVELQTARTRASEEIAQAKLIARSVGEHANQIQAQAQKQEEEAKTALANARASEALAEQRAKEASEAAAKASAEAKLILDKAKKEAAILKATCGTGYSPGGY